MAFQMPDDGDDEVLSQINTTPLVDVMLVLLIIFLITIPVVTSSVPVALPKENIQPRETDPAIVTLAIDAQGQLYWQDQPLKDSAELQQRLQRLKAQDAAVQVQIRADAQSDFAPVGRVLAQLRAQGVQKIGFITEPQ
jgi:biopolymer transport protein ExbD